MLIIYLIMIIIVIIIIIITIRRPLGPRRCEIPPSTFARRLQVLSFRSHTCLYSTQSRSHLIPRPLLLNSVQIPLFSPSSRFQSAQLNSALVSAQISCQLRCISVQLRAPLPLPLLPRTIIWTARSNLKRSMFQSTTIGNATATKKNIATAACALNFHEEHAITT